MNTHQEFDSSYEPQVEVEKAPEKQLNPNDILVRLKPYNPKTGHLCKSYMINGVNYRAETGWYQVDGPTARILSSLRHGKEADSPRVFDVMYRSDAMTLERRAAMANAQRFGATNPNTPSGSFTAFANQSRDGVYRAADGSVHTAVEPNPYAADRWTPYATPEQVARAEARASSEKNEVWGAAEPPMVAMPQPVRASQALPPTAGVPGAPSAPAMYTPPVATSASVPAPMQAAQPAAPPTKAPAKKVKRAAAPRATKSAAEPATIPGAPKAE